MRGMKFAGWGLVGTGVIALTIGRPGATPAQPSGDRGVPASFDGTCVRTMAGAVRCRSEGGWADLAILALVKEYRSRVYR